LPFSSVFSQLKYTVIICSGEWAFRAPLQLFDENQFYR